MNRIEAPPYFEEASISPAGLATVIALHAAVLLALMQLEIVRLPVELKTLTVALIKSPEEIKSPEPPKPPKPKPRPVKKHSEPVKQQPIVLAAPEASPDLSPIVVPPHPPAIAPLPPILVPPDPPVPLEIVEPRFDADYLDNPKPAYPPLSRRMGEEGRVVLRVRVAAGGLPTDIGIHTSSGSARLDQAAFDAVRRWKFVSARRGTEAIAASVLVPIVFSLKE